MKNKKGISILNIPIIICIILLMIFLSIEIYQYSLKPESNQEEADFCKSLGYEVKYQKHFFREMICYKLSEGIRERVYVVEERDNQDELKFFLVRLG